MEKHYPLTQVIKQLKVSPNRIYYLLKIGKIKAVKLPVDEMSQKEVFQVSQQEFDRLKKHFKT